MKTHPAILSTSGRLAVASLSTCIILGSQSARATDLYWDLNGTTANTGTTAAGNWNETDVRWNSDSAGEAAGATSAVTTNTDNIFFSSNTGYSGSFTVTVAGTQNTNSIAFEEGTVTLGGATGTARVVALGATGGIDVATGRTATINVNVSGSNGFAKTGGGILFLGTSNNEFTVNSGLTGTISIKAGAITVGSNTTNATNGQTISLGDTTGSASATFSLNRNQNYNSPVTVNAGSTGVKRLSGGPGLGANQQPSITAAVTLNADLTLGNGATAIYSGNNFGGIRLSSTITGSSKIIADGATAFTTPDAYVTNLANNTLAVTEAKLAGNSSATFTGNVAVERGALSLQNSGAIGTATAVVSTANGGLLNLNNQSVQIAGLIDGSTVGGSVGNLGAGSSGSTSTLTLRGSDNYNYGGTIIGGTYAGTAGSGGWITALNANLTGTQTLGAANTYSGATTVTAGTLKLGNALALGRGSVAFRNPNNATSHSAGANTTTVLAGGTLDLNGQAVTHESVVLNGDGVSSAGALSNSSATAASFSPAISSVSITSSGAWTVGTMAAPPAVIATGGGGSGFAATAHIGLSGGLVTAGGSAYTTAPTVTVTGGGGTGMTIGTSLSSGVVAFSITNAGSGYTSVPTFALTGGAGGSGASISGGALGVVAMTVTDFGTGYTSAPALSIDATGWDTGATATASFSTFNLASDSSVSGAGDITISHAITGIGGLTNAGTHSLILNGSNTYTGNTTVAHQNGSLVLGSSGSLAFKIEANGVNNKITGVNQTGGTGTVTLNGTFQLDLTGAAIANGNSWPIVAADLLPTTTYGESFSVAGFTQAANLWTKVDGANTWTFTEATGLLSLAVSGGGGSYTTWATANGIPGELASEDHDKDGLTNLMEYALGKDPTVSSLPAGTYATGSVSFSKGADAVTNGDVTWAIEESDDLGVTDAWATVTPTVNDASTISYTLPTGKTTVFVRLVVGQP
jgi:autotransporter-associated beta strand protein